MKVQRTSLILVFTALILGGFVYCSESINQSQKEAAKSESKSLFTFKEREVQAFTIQTPKQNLSFEKVKGSVPAGKSGAVPMVWMMRKPENKRANDGAVAFLLNLLATGKSDRTLTIPTARQTEFGLDKPAATVEVTLSNQKTHRLVLGKPNFNRDSLYALIDPPANAKKELAVSLVPIDFQNAVVRSLAEWKQAKPKAQSSPASKKPSPSPSASPSPKLSPAASVSPSPKPSTKTQSTKTKSSSSPAPSPSPASPSR